MSQQVYATAIRLSGVSRKVEEDLETSPGPQHVAAP